MLIDSLCEFQLMLEQENRDLVIEVAPEGVKVKSLYDALLRIILNLVSNAIKYSDPHTTLTI